MSMVQNEYISVYEFIHFGQANREKVTVVVVLR